MSCDNLCTAAKCKELENRISALEQALELLEASFEAHTNQDIPEAHNYTPKVNIGGNYSNNLLNLSVSVDNQSDSVTITVDPHVKSNLKLNGSFQSNILTLTVADGESQDTATITLPKYEPDVTVDLAVGGQNLKVFVAVGSKNDSATITLPIPEIPKAEQHVKSNLRLDGSFQSDVLTLTVADGESQDTATISISLPDLEAEKHIKSNLRLDGSFQSDVLTLTVADGESQDTATISIILPDMNFDNLEREFKDCCESLTNLIASSFNNLDNQLTNLENAINTEIKQVYDEVTIDISGTAESLYTCKFEFENGKFVPKYPEVGSSTITYTGKGLQGINASLEIVNSNLWRMFDSVCKSVQPPQTLYLEDLYQFCDDSNIKRTDYLDGNDGTEDYENAVKAYLQNLLNETKYADLINSANGNILFNAPQYWATNVLADFSLIQGKINNQKLCNLKAEEPDVVSIVASPKYVTNVSGKVLILHFVSEGNYPKRSRGSNYRQIQIPGAKTEYDWELHFENLRWSQGNQYAELVLNEYRATISGWFGSENAANAFFDDVLSLTIGTEKNRKFPKHKYPRTDIQAQITLPYRAFIESINLQGQAVCHVKYVPPIKP